MKKISILMITVFAFAAVQAQDIKKDKPADDATRKENAAKADHHVIKQQKQSVYDTNTFSKQAEKDIVSQKAGVVKKKKTVSKKRKG